MIKLNKLELDLLRKAVGWYYKEFRDKELRAAVVKEKPSKDDLERMKDAVDLYHKKGYVSENQHPIMKSLFEKFGKNIKSTTQKQIEAQEKAKAKELKEKAEEERKEKAKIEKERQDKLKQEEQERKKREEEQAELEKEQYKISDAFTDVSPNDDNI